MRKRRSRRARKGDRLTRLEADQTGIHLDVARVLPPREPPVVRERIELARKSVEVRIDRRPAVREPHIQRLAVAYRRDAEPRHLARFGCDRGKTDPAEGSEIHSRVVMSVAVFAEARTELPRLVERPAAALRASDRGGADEKEKRCSGSFDHNREKVSPAPAACQRGL